MENFSGILFTLKKREQNISEDDSVFYKYIILGFYDGLDIHTVDRWYDLRPRGLLDRKLQVDLQAPFIDQYTIRAFMPANRDELDTQGFAYRFWEDVGRADTQKYARYKKSIKKKYPFICMSIINLTEEFVKEQDNLQMIQDKLIRIFQACVSEADYDLPDLHCAIYPSMGYSDFIILFLTDDLLKTANIINQMRAAATDSGVTIVSSCYSVCGLDKSYFAGKSDGLAQNIQISIRINLKEGISARDFLDYLNNELCGNTETAGKNAEELETFVEAVNQYYYVTFGNSDCLLLPDQPLDKYLRWHGSGQILNPGNPFFIKYIADVRTSVRIMGDKCLFTGNFHGDGKVDLISHEKDFKEFIEKYEAFLEAQGMHIRSSRALQQIMKNFLNIAQASHGFDARKIVGDAFLSLIKSMEYYISLAPKKITSNMTEKKRKEYKDYNAKIWEQQICAVETLEEFKEYVGSFIADLTRSDRPFIEGNVLTHSSIGSATKLLFAYSAMLEKLTKRFNRQRDFSFVVSSGGCDKTKAIDLFPFSNADSKIKKPIIIMIPEMSLYDIQGTLFRILHEYMHFIGNRRRRERYRYIINALAKYIAWEMVESMFGQYRLETFLKCTNILSESLKEHVRADVCAKYEELKENMRCEISDAIRLHRFFTVYETEGGREDFYSTALKKSILHIESIVDVFCAEKDKFEEEADDNLQKIIYKIVYEADKKLLDFMIADLEKLRSREGGGGAPEGKSILMPLQAYQNLRQNYTFRDGSPQAYDRKLRRYIEQYISALLRNFPLNTGGRVKIEASYDYETIRDEIMFSMVEGFSDCCAARTIRMKEEDFLLSFIYEAWEIDQAFPETFGNTLRLGADLQVLYGIKARLSDQIKERVRKKAEERNRQGYTYRNVEEMLERIDVLLERYLLPELAGIRGELEAYLHDCIDAEEEWYSEDLGELYTLCDMDSSEKVYAVVDKIICLWKNLGGVENDEN